MKKKKKITWVDAETAPGEDFITVNPQDEKSLLVVVEGHPYPLIGIYRKIEIKGSDGKTKERTAHWHVRGLSDPDRKVLAWRPISKIPEEYHKATGYDKVIEARQRAEARKT